MSSENWPAQTSFEDWRKALDEQGFPKDLNDPERRKACKVSELIITITASRTWSDTALARVSGFSRGWIIARRVRLQQEGMWGTQEMLDPKNFSRVYQVAEKEYRKKPETRQEMQTAAFGEIYGSLSKELEGFAELGAKAQKAVDEITLPDSVLGKLEPKYGLVALLVRPYRASQKPERLMLLPESQANPSSLTGIVMEARKHGMVVQAIPFERVASAVHAQDAIRKLTEAPST